MKYFFALPALAIAAAILVFTAAPALGAESQPEIVQAFRLLNQVGLVAALPASDDVLSSLDPFEMAAMVDAAAQRLGISNCNHAIGRETPAERVVHYLGAAGSTVPAARVIAAFALLEQVLMKEMRLLERGPYFVAIAPENAVDLRPATEESTSNDMDVFVVPGTLRDYRLLSGSPAAGAGLELPILF